MFGCDLAARSAGGEPDVVGIFLDRASLIRPVGLVLTEQHDETIEGRRYIGLDVLTSSGTVLASTDRTADLQTVTTPA